MPVQWMNLVNGRISGVKDDGKVNQIEQDELQDVLHQMLLLLHKHRDAADVEGADEAERLGREDDEHRHRVESVQLAGALAEHVEDALHRPQFLEHIASGRIIGAVPGVVAVAPARWPHSPPQVRAQEPDPMRQNVVA